MLTQFTLMPVCLVNSASKAFGGDGYATATVIDFELVLPALLLLLLPQAALSITRATEIVSGTIRLPVMRRFFICILSQRVRRGMCPEG
jgi:hypothetical protein